MYIYNIKFLKLLFYYVDHLLDDGSLKYDVASTCCEYSSLLITKFGILFPFLSNGLK